MGQRSLRVWPATATVPAARAQGTMALLAHGAPGWSVQRCSTVVTLAPIRAPSNEVDSLGGHLAHNALRRTNGEHVKES
ncbi:hypothetical protein [Arthrobacter alpinus]|uniref:hypothetical protein n=1 Tax=Arthrobacter alpinus TaxID=656366 RepID=UPI00101ADCA5|nr:hypothetical protein [Arthrobacter alpinus]